MHKDLEQRGWEVFLDTKNIKVGDSISETISAAIRGCHGMIVIFSEQYVESGWCKNEILQAVSSGKKKLYPIRRQDIKYPDLLEFHLSDLRWLDIFSDDQYAAGLEDLIVALEAVRMSAETTMF